MALSTALARYILPVFACCELADWLPWTCVQHALSSKKHVTVDFDARCTWPPAQGLHSAIEAARSPGHKMASWLREKRKEEKRKTKRKRKRKETKRVENSRRQ